MFAHHNVIKQTLQDRQLKPIDECCILLKELLREVHKVKKDVEELKKHIIKDEIDLLIEDKTDPIGKSAGSWFF